MSTIYDIVDVLSGYNGTIFAYGQTSSGKTHTMEVGTVRHTHSLKAYRILAIQDWFSKFPFK